MNLPEVKDYRLTEGLNQLKTNLAFCGKDIKVITITSSVPNEGKSSVAFDLSKTMAEGGKKILMVDADLRKSVLAARYHIQGIDKGLSHYLTGQAEIEDIIYETETEGFYLSVAGPLSPDPTSLLDSDQFQKFIDKVREDYDYVIIDTPPMANLIDSAIVASNCDGAIIVVEQGAVSYRLEQKVKSQLDKTGCRVLGVVLNKVDLSQNGYYGRYGKYGKYGKYGRYGKYDKYGAYSPYEKAEAAQTTDK